MKTYLFIISVFCLPVFSCCIFNAENNTETETAYTAKIAWDSGLFSNDYGSTMVDGDYVYFYERPPEYDQVNIYTLTKLDAETGNLIWRSVMFSNIIFCQPIVIDGYVYVFLEPNGILCFDKETGEHTATVEVKIENKDTKLVWNISSYQQYIYLSDTCFTRLNVNAISHTGSPDILQTVTPEIIWQPNHTVNAKPVIANNTVYTSTRTFGYAPIELAGFDIDTKEMVFYKTFGINEDPDDSFPETGGYVNPIFVHDNILYYLSLSISAWDLKTGECLYHHVFSESTPTSKLYYANGIIQAIYYQGNIYYTSTNNYETPEDRNIHCINAKTGKLVWNAIAKGSETLDTNLIVANDKVYVSQFNGGFRVYDPKTGKLLGTDHSFYGHGQSRNVLYKDYIICIRMDPNTGDGRLVAVDISE